MQERFTLTKVGYDDLRRELRSLETRYLEGLAEFADVQGYVDPAGAEGAYFEAKSTKEQIEDRMNHLKMVLNHADVFEEDPDPEVVDPGDRVTVWDLSYKETLHFDLVGGAEIIHAVREGVSIDSPVGLALIGRRVGDVVEVDVPDGKAKYAIRKIEPIPVE